MKILFDCREAIRNVTGIGTYVRNLSRELQRIKDIRATCVCIPERPTVPPPPRMRSRREQVLHLLENLYWKQVYLPQRFLSERADLLVCMDPVTPLVFPGKMAVIVYDLVFLTGSAQTSAWTYYWRFMVPRAVRRAARIFTLSQATQCEISRQLLVDEAKIRVFRTGVGTHFRPLALSLQERQKLASSLGLPSSFILTVGAHEPRRNVRTLLEAFHLLVHSRHTAHKLVVVGPKTRFFSVVYEHAARLELLDHVLFLDHVPHEELHLYYNLADIYVYPSLEEGFGLTPLEAMACGCPVITSNVSSLPEVVGEAAVLVDPHDVAALAQAIAHLLDHREERERPSLQGRGHGQSRSWEQGAKDILEGCLDIM